MAITHDRALEKGANNLENTMRTRPRAESRTVSLTGIPHFAQGHSDSLCVYYAGAMLLAALRPEFSDSFDLSERDPIVANMPLHGKQERDRLVRSWLYGGNRLIDLRLCLNRICASDEGTGTPVTSFAHEERNKVDSLFSDLAAEIDKGLPCIISWDGDAIGSHATVVTGIATYADKSKWLLLHDPSGDEAIEWEQLRRLCQGRLNLLTCTEHTGHRPDRLTVLRDKLGLVGSRRLERFEAGAWAPCYQNG